MSHKHNENEHNHTHCNESHCCCHSEHKHEEHHETNMHNHDEHNKTQNHSHDEHNKTQNHSHDEHNHEHSSHSGCGCGHDHEHGGDIEKKDIAKLFLAGALLIAAIFVGEYAKELSDIIKISLGTVETISLLIYLIAYFTVGGEVVRTAVKNISKGHVFDENFLMSIATVGAFFIGEYPEAVAVMMFYHR